MIGLVHLAQLLGRSRRMNAYRRAKARVECLTDADFADMGMKRAQSGTVARKLALR